MSAPTNRPPKTKKVTDRTEIGLPDVRRKADQDLLAVATDELNAVQQEMVRLQMEGLRPGQIARRLHCSTGLVRAILHSDAAEEYRDDLQVDGALKMAATKRKMAESAVEHAVEVLHSVVSGQLDATLDQRIRAALAILDREPNRRFTKNESQTVNACVEVRQSQYTPEERDARVKEFVARARGCTVEELEASAKNRKLLDATPADAASERAAVADSLRASALARSQEISERDAGLAQDFRYGKNSSKELANPGFHESLFRDEQGILK